MDQSGFYTQLTVNTRLKLLFLAVISKLWKLISECIIHGLLNYLCWSQFSGYHPVHFVATPCGKSAFLPVLCVNDIDSFSCFREQFRFKEDFYIR